METKLKIWIVGASSGIGLELVRLLLSDQHYVVASSRSASKSEELISLKQGYSSTLELVDIDINKDDLSLEIKKAWEAFSGLDIWFYNVGSYDVMGIDEWDKDKFIGMNSTNYLGAIKIMCDIVPYFKKQKSGKWIWNLSLSTYFGLPRGGGYSAPKAGLLNLAQSIQPELEKENIKLQIINHGFVKTRLTAKNTFEMPQLMSAKYCANKIYEGMNKEKGFEISFPFGLKTFLRLLALLPYKLSFLLTKKSL